METQIEFPPRIRNAQIAWLQRALREKRGTGSGANYIPWLQVRRFDLNSRGRSHVIPNPFFKRQHHVLSDLEADVFLMLLWARPKDIREQYPLQPHFVEVEFLNYADSAMGTECIAKTLGYRHPLIRKGIPRRLTTDFLVTHLDGTHTAIYVKYSEELTASRRNAVGDTRLSQLLEIAREYWKQRGIALLEVTELDISQNAIRWCMWCFDALDRIFSAEIRDRFVKKFINTNTYECTQFRLEESAKELKISKLDCTLLLKQCIFLRELYVDFSANIDLTDCWDAKISLPTDTLPKWHFLSNA